MAWIKAAGDTVIATVAAIIAVTVPVLTLLLSNWWNKRSADRGDRSETRESMALIIEGFTKLREHENDALEKLWKELDDAQATGRITAAACRRCQRHLDDILEAWDELGRVIDSEANQIRSTFYRSHDMVAKISEERLSERNGRDRQRLQRRRAARKMFDDPGAGEGTNEAEDTG